MRAGKLPLESDYGFAFDIAPADAQQALSDARTFVAAAAAAVATAAH